MAKKEDKKRSETTPSNVSRGLPFVAKDADSTLTSLFASSAGPVTAPSNLRYGNTTEKARSKRSRKEHEHEEDDASSGGLDEDAMDAIDDEESSSDGVEDEATQAMNVVAELTGLQEDAKSRKRKRKGQETALEDLYMQRLADDEAKDEAKRKLDRPIKRLKAVGDDEDGAEEESLAAEAESQIGEEASALEDAGGSPVPQHESLAPSNGASEVEKASRTVFFGNVSSSAITSKADKKMLESHLASFLPSLSAHDPPHKVLSLRFRSTAYSSNVPKKAAFAKKELMDATTKSTNAYAVYSTQIAAREAAKRLNGTIVLGRHLRVDEVAHPAKMAPRRCVFIGNLSVVDDDSAIQAQTAAYQDRKPKKRQPADVEEGLWREFSKVGTVESVRVVRDSKTRVGLGIAYVQFTDENAVEAALLMNDKKFPPLLPRKLRVERCKSVKRNATKSGFRDSSAAAGIGYTRKPTSQEMSLKGRAGKLLGRAGAAQMRSGQRGSRDSNKSVAVANGIIKAPEAIVFEGHRASSKQGKSGLKLGGSGKSKGKPRTRSSKRGEAWKASGGKKASK